MRDRGAGRRRRAHGVVPVVRRSLTIGCSCQLAHERGPVLARRGIHDRHRCKRASDRGEILEGSLAGGAALHMALRLEAIGRRQVAVEIQLDRPDAERSQNVVIRALRCRPSQPSTTCGAGGPRHEAGA